MKDRSTHRARRSMSSFGIALLMALSSHGCKARPLYSKEFYNRACIQIDSIPSIEGAELYHRLSQLLGKCSKLENKYKLSVNLSFDTEPSIIRKNSRVLRTNMSQIVEYILYRTEDNEILTRGKFKNRMSYQESESPYSAYINNDEALKNISQDSAEEIGNRLRIFFYRNNGL